MEQLELWTDGEYQPKPSAMDKLKCVNDYWPDNKFDIRITILMTQINNLRKSFHVRNGHHQKRLDELQQLAEFLIQERENENKSALNEDITW